MVSRLLRLDAPSKTAAAQKQPAPAARARRPASRQRIKAAPRRTRYKSTRVSGLLKTGSNTARSAADEGVHQKLFVHARGK